MRSAETSVQLSTRSSLKALTAAIELFRELRPEMPIHPPLVFLMVAQHKGISAARLGELTGVSQSAVSRNLSALTKEGRAGEPGLGLVTRTIDPMNPRAHAMHLTKDGRALAARLAQAIGGSVRLRGGVAGVETGHDRDADLSPAAAPPDAYAGAHWEVWVD